jgi:hypothetical protein
LKIFFSHFYAKQVKNGNANPKQKLIISQQVFKVSQKPSEYRRTASGSKTKIPSQQVPKICQQFFHQSYA